MQVHPNAATNKKQRRLFYESLLSTRVLAIQCKVSHTTVATWKHRESQEDRSSAPRTRHYALTDGEQEMVLFLRAQEFSLDEVTGTVLPILPAANRSNIYRVLRRHGVHRRPQPPREKRGTFKDYPPGFVHIDCFRLPQLGGKKRYCFVAVDRCTRLAYLHVYDQRSAASAVDFLARCQAFFPFRIETVLTDNGGEFMRMVVLLHGQRVTKRPHGFGAACAQAEITHRTTKPYAPWTNGMVERMNGLIKEQTVKRQAYPSHPAIEAGLELWMKTYNCYRPHPRLGYRTPYQLVCDWSTKNPERFLKDPTHVLTCLGVNKDVKLDT